MELDLKDLRRLLRLLEKRDISEFEFEDERIRLRLVRGGTARSATSRMVDEAASATATAAAAMAITTITANAAAATDDDAGMVYVTSPFVGTFYRSSSPDAPTFVEIGSAIREGQALCIVEAMKLMNEIEADCAGTIVDVLAENGKPVEFGQKLFKVRRA